MRNFGGSLLASEGWDTLKPVIWNRATLQVVRCDPLETYFLTLTHPKGTSILAEKANGHSLKALADRMHASWSGEGSVERAMQQRDYIEQCGGMVRPASCFDFYLGDDGKVYLS
jgi:hypothetical protein